MAEYYKISGETLTAIADHTRTMAGINRKLTPAEIEYWLGRVKFIPQGWANSAFALDFAPTTATARLPAVVKATANSEFAVTFESTATGVITE